MTSTDAKPTGGRCVIADLTCQSCNRTTGEIGGTAGPGRSPLLSELHFRPTGGRWRGGGVPAWRCAHCGGRLLLDNVLTLACRPDSPPPWAQPPLALAELPPERRSYRPRPQPARPRRGAAPVPITAARNQPGAAAG